jgi:hypothetical protein
MIDDHAHKCQHLEVDSRLEIAFEGKPKGFQAPSYKVFTNENSNGTVVFDVETRVVQRYITPGCTYNDLEIERTDYLSDNSAQSLETGLYVEPTVGSSRAPERTPSCRFSKFPRHGEYMVPRQETYQVPVNRIGGSPVTQYANLPPTHRETHPETNDTDHGGGRGDGGSPSTDGGAARATGGSWN